MLPRTHLIACSLLLILHTAPPTNADDKAPTAAELAASLNSAVEDGDSFTRLRVEVKPSAGGKGSVMQLQIKARRSARKAQVVYQMLYPKDRKGEAFLLSKSRSGAPSGSKLRPPNTVSKLNS